jgi:hypothetical protein
MFAIVPANREIARSAFADITTLGVVATKSRKVIHDRSCEESRSDPWLLFLIFKQITDRFQPARATRENRMTKQMLFHA